MLFMVQEKSRVSTLLMHLSKECDTPCMIRVPRLICGTGCTVDKEGGARVREGRGRQGRKRGRKDGGSAGAGDKEGGASVKEGGGQQGRRRGRKDPPAEGEKDVRASAGSEEGVSASAGDPIDTQGQ